MRWGAPRPLPEASGRSHTHGSASIWNPSAQGEAGRPRAYAVSRYGPERLRRKVDVDFELDDVTAPYSARGWDIIFRIQHLGCRTVDSGARIVYELAAAMVIPDLRYEMSLDATPVYTLTRWSPPADRDLASVITYETSCGLSVQILFTG
jgi:hypothetical protein